MTMHKALHPGDDIDRIYESRKEEERGFTSIEDSDNASIRRLEYYIEKRGGKLITATRNNTDNTGTNRTTITRNGGARGVMVIVTGYGHGDTSSIPGQD